MEHSDANSRTHARPIPVERVQVGARMEKSMVKVLKALAEYLDLSLGDLLEGIVLQAFEQRQPFSAETLKRINQLREVYGMGYDASASHHFIEASASQPTERQPS
ncbi:MAG TPA: hypothetical protein VE338_15995 [Ktedonobacterales bacterium]|nr:hypothetical protein [Ktedonobacterales bacterium]